MSKFTIALKTVSPKITESLWPNFLFGLALMSIYVLTASFTTIDDKDSMLDSSTDPNCENPLINALGYNAFVRYEAHLGGGDTEGPIAIGGDLTMDGIITVAAQTAGTNFFNGDNEASSLVINGKVIYDSGQGIQLNQGFVKVGDLSGSSVFDTDFNNALVNTRVTSGGYDKIPRVQVHKKQSANLVGQGNLIDFETAFVGLESKSTQFSALSANVILTGDHKITLIQNEFNVLNLTGSELQNLPYITFENTPNINTPLVINVDASGDFEWNVLNLAGIGDHHGDFIIWNFFNATSITLNGGGTIVGSLFAPTSSVIKNSSGNINGQVIAANYYHNGGELHHHDFDSCVETNVNCDLTVDAGDDVSICGEGEVTLEATVSGESVCENCTGVFGVENTDQCNQNQNYVMWLTDGDNSRWFSNVDLEWKEFEDGTATLTGTVFDYTLTQTTYEVDVTFSGKTNSPSDSPKEHLCNDEDTSGWIFYEEFTGKVISTDGSWSVDISRRGPAYQLGNGANQTETELGKYGACGWFNTTDNTYDRGDFNINISDCVTTQTSDVSYLWSTGETTSSITVAESGNYTVTVKDCENCEASDSVEVSFNTGLEVDAGEDQTICNGDEAVLTATVSGESECTDCVGYGVQDTNSCRRDENYVMWLTDGDNPRWFSNVDLEWKEFGDGTATLSGTVFDHTSTQTTYEVDVTFSGKTNTPSDSPKEHVCHDEDSSAWMYYEEFTGKVTSTDGSWSVDISRRGPAFQLGNGANQTETEVGKYGACGWFDTTDSIYNRGDFNINIGDCIATETSDVSYLWSTGETTQTITVTEGGTYTVTVQDCTDCEASDSVEVTFTDGPDVDAGEDQTICLGDEVVLSASVNGNEDCEDCVGFGVSDTDYCTASTRQYVVWLYDQATARNRWFTNVDLAWNQNVDGTATLKGTVYNSDLDQNFEVDVTFTGLTTTAPADSPKEHNCYEEDATGWEYYTAYTGTITSEDGSWSTDISLTGPAFQLGNGANTNETVEGKYGASGWFTTSDSEFTFGDININIEDCVSTQNGGTTYLWSTGETTSSITVSPEEDTTYTVTVTTCEDCVGSDEVTVFVEEATADAGDDQTICSGEEATLTVSGEGTYLWSTGETTSSINVSPDVTTEYTVTVTNGGCEATDMVTVIVDTLTVDAGADQTICLGDEITLTATGGDTYVWSNGETTASIVVSPQETTTYTVTASIGNCDASDDVIVNVNTVTADAGEDVTITLGDTTTLTASGGGSYLWSTGDTSASIEVSPQETTTYSVTVSKDGCEATDEVTVFVEGCDVAANAGEDQTICLGDEIVLTAIGGDTYVWSNGEITASIVVSPQETTTYSVTVSKDGCNASDDVVVNVNTVTANAGDDVTITLGDTTTLTASGGDSYLWSTGDTSASIDVSPLETTTYSVTVSKDGCEATDEVTVFVEGCDVVADAGADQTICLGDEITLTATGGDTYVWSTGETTASIVVSPQETTTYTVTASIGNCDASDNVVVNVNDVTANAGDDVTIILGDMTTLTASGGDSYLWSTGDTSASIEVSPSETTIYSVTVSKDGCEATDEVTVFVEGCDVIADAGEDQDLCIISDGGPLNRSNAIAEEVTLTATGGDTYLWSTGETTQSITVSPEETTTYTVTVSRNICSDTDDVTVFVTEIIPDAGDDIVIFEGDSVELTATGGDSYLWSTGETTATIVVTPTEDTIYTVTVSIGDCSGTDDVQVSIGCPEHADAGEDQTICNGEEATLTASDGQAIQWSTGETTQSITVSPTSNTTYSVVILKDGCVATDQVTVFVEDCANLSMTKTYPMPVNLSGKLSVDLETKVDQEIKISVYKMSGHQILAPKTMSVTKGANTIQIDMSTLGDLSVGVYMLKIDGENMGTTTRMIVVK